MEEDILTRLRRQLTETSLENVQTQFSESELIDDERLNLQLDNPRDIYDRLGPTEKWREHIDGRHQHLGRDVYRDALHRGGDSKDPLYSSRLMAADRYVASTLGKSFGVEEYDKIHKLVTGGGAFERGVRKEATRFTYDGLLARPVDLMMEDSNIESIETKSIDGIEKETVIKMAPVEDAMGEVARILRNYERRIRELKQRDLYTPENVLREIASAHKKLENLHPHIDFNTRTHRLLLNRMLAENNLPLTILHNPLDVSRTRFSDWVKEIERGQTEWLKRAIQVPRDQTPRDWKRFSELGSRFDSDSAIELMLESKQYK